MLAGDGGWHKWAKSFRWIGVLSSHKRVAERERIEAAGANPMFLPTYSPDFNPIGKAFPKLKALLRKSRRT